MKIKSLFGVLPLMGMILMPFGSVRAADEITINSTNFPSPTFRAEVTKYDADKNGALSAEEIAQCTSLEFSLDSNDIGALYSLTSIQDLELNSWSNDGLDIDLTKLPQLKTLYLDAIKGSIHTLDLSKNTKLTKLRVDSYGGESLNISYCKNLEDFQIYFADSPQKVDLSKNTKLKRIYASNMESVDLSKNTALEELHIGLSTSELDLSHNTKLKILEIFNLNIRNFDLSMLTNLEWLSFNANNSNPAYDLSNHTKLEYLSLKAADLKQTDFSKLTKIKFLNVQASRFQDGKIDLTKMTDLETLSVWQCTLASLDVSKNTNLKDLNCSDCKLSDIDLSKNTALEQLYCSNNKFDSLDLSKNVSLKSLRCCSNETVISDLDLTACTALKSLQVDNFKNIKIGDCPDLGDIYIYKNTETIEFGNCPYLHRTYINNTSIKDLDMSSCPLYMRATNDFESTVSNGIVTVSGTLSVNHDGKVADVSCYFSLDSTINVTADKLMITSETFPDENLRTCVSKQADKDKDGFLSKKEISQTVTIDCSGKNISDLTGLDIFSNLETLDCSNNGLASLNVNCFTKLKKLICSHNNLTNSKFVTDNAPIVYLDCSYNQLTSFSDKHVKTLETFKASHNQLTSASLLNFKKLKHIEVDNNALKGMTIGKQYEYVDCSNNQITYLHGHDTSSSQNGYNLKVLYCQNNMLNGLDFNDFDLLAECKAYGNDLKHYVNLTRSMSDLYPERTEKKIGDTECIVLGDKYFFDKDAKIIAYLKIDEKNFPDAGLREALANYDADKDGYISNEEKRIERLDCSGYGIKDLTGVEKLNVEDLDCSFNDLSELDITELVNDDDVAFREVTCYGNPKLKSLIVFKVFPLAGMTNISMTQRTETVNVRGKDVVVTYDSHSYFSYFTFNVDPGVRIVGDAVYVSVTVPESAGVLTGDGAYERNTKTDLEFKPAEGVEFAGWFENGSLVSSDTKLSFEIAEDRALTIVCKMPQTVVFENAAIKKTLGDKPFTIEAKGAKTPVVYSGNNPKVAKVDASTGKVTLVGIGECTITAKASATDQYFESSASYKLTVAAAPTATPIATPTSTSAPKPTVKVTATPKVTVTPEPTLIPSDPKTQILAFVERIYIYVLDREPEAEGAAFWSDELYSFRRTGAEVAQGFIFSDEFINRNTSDKEFVTILYKTFFGRDPEEEGFNYWVGELASGAKDRVTVANGFIYSQEWADTCAAYGIRSGGDLKPSGTIEPTELTYAFVERMYTTALGRGYDEEGKQYWASELANFNITGESVGAFFFLSDEMNGYGLSDQEYLNRLYATFMNREPDADGAAYWLSVLSSGTPRADVVFGFTRSPEFTEKCVEARILPY